MRTARLLPVSPSMHYGGGCLLGGGVCSGGGGVCSWVGVCLWSGGCLFQGVSASGLGGVCSRGVSAPWGVWGGVCSGGVCLWSRGGLLLGVYPCMHWGRPPPVNRMTDRCKNITLPQTSFAGGKNAQRNLSQERERWTRLRPST